MTSFEVEMLINNIFFNVCNRIACNQYYLRLLWNFQWTNINLVLNRLTKAQHIESKRPVITSGTWQIARLWRNFVNKPVIFYKMSSRALRKLQRDDLENLNIPEDNSDNEEETHVSQNRKNKKKQKAKVGNLFDLVSQSLLSILCKKGIFFIKWITTL